MLEFFYENFIDPLNYEFYRVAIITSILVSISTAIVSVVVVNKNWAMLGMGLSNSVFPGVVLGSLLHFPMSMTLGAFITGLFCFYLTNFILRHSRLKADAALGMCYSCFFAIGLLLLSFVKTESHITHILFGNLLGVEESDYYELLIISIIVIIFSITRFRDIILFTFDELQFKILGLGFERFHNLMLVILTLTIIASLQAIGILLTIYYLVLPAVTAQLFSKRLRNVMLLGIFVNLISSYFGLSLSYILNVSTGPTIVVMQTSFFLIAFVYRRIRNWLMRNQKIAQEQQERLQA
ncbi:metal ABC transporter permease [Psittacicella gerlachiana]|uniref:Metal ABC transporter permease n=1 Tax=Psittacicella gerlachiana TaxID=2028574 RepID=A0A3A1YAR8_9GAMM|nr:metal ABC transporter permease [Psittacicella gerlachiana]RIY34631.1 hypothetical protein CKF59_05205 [Psittacicella gerlachiana]